MDKHKAMVRYTDHCVGRLVKALDSAGLNARPTEAKETLLLVLGTLREKKAIPGVAKHLDDPEIRVREAAIRSLGRMRADARPHVGRVAAMFDEGSPRTRLAVARALT